MAGKGVIRATRRNLVEEREVRVGLAVKSKTLTDICSLVDAAYGTMSKRFASWMGIIMYQTKASTPGARFVRGWELEVTGLHSTYSGMKFELDGILEGYSETLITSYYVENIKLMNVTRRVS